MFKKINKKNQIQNPKNPKFKSKSNQSKKKGKEIGNFKKATKN